MPVACRWTRSLTPHRVMRLESTVKDRRLSRRLCDGANKDAIVDATTRLPTDETAFREGAKGVYPCVDGRAADEVVDLFREQLRQAGSGRVEVL